MKGYEEIIGEACRIEYEESTGKMFIVFEIKNEKQKNFIKVNWTNDIEYRLIDRLLVLEIEKEKK
jgi:nuclear transport factor 2 (NTF2) superfamily protein